MSVLSVDQLVLVERIALILHSDEANVLLHVFKEDEAVLVDRINAVDRSRVVFDCGSILVFI